jgi:RNA polymerase sigma factor (sigma-70 family)
MPTLPPDQLFLTYLPHIKRVATHACRKACFSREDTEDFISDVQCKMIEGDYAVFRKFQGKSTLETYLTVVVRRHFQDHLNHIWGKWRPSAEAVRLGPLAIQLDRLLHRDGFSLDEAHEILRTNHHIEISLHELAALARKLPRRNPPRRMESDEVLKDYAHEGPDPAETVIDKEERTRCQEILGFLEEAMAPLSDEDALLVRMSVKYKVAEIARILRIEQKPLYPRLDKILKALRRDLEGRGVRPEEIEEILGTSEGGDDEE